MRLIIFAIHISCQITTETLKKKNIFFEIKIDFLVSKDAICLSVYTF